MFYPNRSTVIPQINFLTRSKDTKKQKCMRRMNILFIFLQVVLSLDFGFVKYKSSNHKTIIKVVTLAQCLCISVTCITCFFIYMNRSQAIWYSVFCFEYVSYVVVLIFSNSEKSFFVLQNDLNSLDSVIGVNSISYNLDVSMIASCLIIAIFRMGLAFVYCAIYPEFCVLIPFVKIIYFIPLFCVDIVLVIYFFTFYSIYRRLKKFTDFVKNTSDVTCCHYIYKSIVDFTEKVKETFDAVVSN